MSFRSGTVAYARFRVDGGPTAVDASLLEDLASNVLDDSGGVAPPPIAGGWVAGRHLFDHEFEPEIVSFGDTLLFGLRIDTNQVPAEVRRSYLAMARHALAQGGPAPGSRANMKDEVEDRCAAELRSGRYRRSRLVPILWNVTRRTLLAPVFSDNVSLVMRDLFRESFDATLEPLGSGSFASSLLRGHSGQRDIEDLTPSLFTPKPTSVEAGAGADGREPIVPWTRRDPGAKEFLGNEFLMWLWSRSETSASAITTGAGEVAILLDRVLDMECAWDVAGKQMLRADGCGRMPEAGKGLATGKWPRKAGLVLAADGLTFTLMLQSDRFLVQGLRLPKPEEQPASEREVVEDRLGAIETFDRALTSLYTAFLKQRIGGEWATERRRIETWIQDRGAGKRAEVDLAREVEGVMAHT